MDVFSLRIKFMRRVFMKKIKNLKSTQLTTYFFFNNASLGVVYVR